MTTRMQLTSENLLDNRMGGPQQQYETGFNCKDIRQDDSGRWWIDFDSHHSCQIPDHMIRGVLTTRTAPVAGVSKEEALPEFAQRNGESGGYLCKACERPFGSLHAVIVHHGRAHRE